MRIYVSKGPLTDIQIPDPNIVFQSIQEAIDKTSAGDEVIVTPGHYLEKVEVRTPGIAIRGMDRETCVVTYGDHAVKRHRDGSSYGTFRTYTMAILADDVSVSGLTIQNDAGDGREVGQAIALYVDGTRNYVGDCRLDSHQDTLFAGPLPPHPRIPGSFRGPSEGKAYKRCLQYYDQCEIIGDVDFIFGSALAVFKDCQLITRDRSEGVNGYVTAPSTWQGEAYGFLFLSCRFLGEEGIAPGTVFLGRPWRPYAQAMLIDCRYDDAIHHEHWDCWGDEGNKATARFSEYACHNPLARQMGGSLRGDGTFIRIEDKVPDLSFLEKWHREVLERSEQGDKNDL